LPQPNTFQVDDSKAIIRFDVGGSVQTFLKSGEYKIEGTYCELFSLYANMQEYFKHGLFKKEEGVVTKT